MLSYQGTIRTRKKETENSGVLVWQNPSLCSSNFELPSYWSRRLFVHCRHRFRHSAAYYNISLFVNPSLCQITVGDIREQEMLSTHWFSSCSRIFRCFHLFDSWWTEITNVRSAFVRWNHRIETKCLFVWSKFSSNHRWCWKHWRIMLILRKSAEICWHCFIIKLKANWENM